jgi:putative flavoprotein involved in K+ transport
VGNSGADIAIDVARTHKTLLAGKETGHVPFPIEAFAGRNILVRLVRFVGHHVLTIKTPVGRKLRPKMLHGASPLIRVKPKDLDAAGVERLGRITGIRNGKPVAGDEVFDVQNVIWCTGYQTGFSWIDLPIFDADGDPMHVAGAVPSQPGLYFVGLHFLYSMTSDTITGMRRDAARVVRWIASRRPNGARAAEVLAAGMLR